VIITAVIPGEIRQNLHSRSFSPSPQCVPPNSEQADYGVLSEPGLICDRV